MKERLLYIDRLRGLSILGVVVGHFISLNTSEGNNGSLWIMLSAFKMTFFMFLCGYIAFKTTREKIFTNYLSFILKKSRTLLLPFLAWPLLVMNFFFTSSTDYNYTEIHSIIVDGHGGYWFLWFIFYMSIFYSFFLFASLKWNKGNNLLYDLLIASVQIAIIVLIKYSGKINYIDKFLFYYGFYLAGVFVAKFEFFQKVLLNRYIFSISLIIFASLIGWYDDSDYSAKNLIVKIVVSLAAIASLYYWGRRVAINKHIDKYLLLWGKNSIVIYVTHFIVIFTISQPYLLPKLNPFVLLAIAIVVSVFVIFLCFLIYDIVKLSPVLNLLLYGNKIEQETDLVLPEETVQKEIPLGIQKAPELLYQ